MISEQVNNNIRVQVPQGSFVNGGGSIGSAQSLSNISRGLIGGKASQAFGVFGGAKAAQAEVAGGLTGLLGCRESLENFNAQSSRNLNDKTETFTWTDPDKSVNWHIGDHGIDELSDYGKDFMHNMVGYTYGGDTASAFRGTSADHPAFVTDSLPLTSEFRDKFNIPANSSSNLFPEDISKAMSNAMTFDPSAFTQACAPSNFATPASTGVGGMENYFNTSAMNYFSTPKPNEDSAVTLLHSYQGAIDDMGASVYSQRDSIMSQRDPLMSLVQDGNSLAYSDLANLYNLNGVGTETFQVPDLNIDSYLEQTYQSNLAALRQPDAIENYFSDAGTQQGFENLGNFVNMTTGNMGQATAISTNELIAKYNSQMTDGILGLDEMKSMYDKAFASGNMNTLYMA
ncbi:hypothetical protein IJT93_01755 [bacterium]|nr:hypothetical protein [bacterium]